MIRSFAGFPSNVKGDYEDQITSIKFKNTADVKYGAILHEGRNYTSTCKEFLNCDTANCPIIPTHEDNKFPGGGNEGVSSATVFIQPNEPPDLAKGGVTLYEKENFLETDSAGKKIFWPQDKPAQGEYKDLSNYTYENSTRVGDHVLSLKIDDNYLVLLFKDMNFQNKCEVVSANDFNLGVDNPVGKDVSSLKVIPAQK